MWMRFVVLACGLLLAAASVAQSSGDWVLARWRGGDYWFPGVIADRSADSVTVVYDDGTRETLPLHLIRPYDWRVGSQVQCRWKNGTEWYAGRITAIKNDGVTLHIEYDDGDREKTKTAACRSR